MVETVVVLIFAAGVWFGRRSRFLWLCLSCMAFDMLIHLGLGFGINEVQIMAPHFLFVLPIATAFLLRGVRKYGGTGVRLAVTALTAYLFTYNGVLLIKFLFSTITATL